MRHLSWPVPADSRREHVCVSYGGRQPGRRMVVTERRASAGWAELSCQQRWRTGLGAALAQLRRRKAPATYSRTPEHPRGTVRPSGAVVGGLIEGLFRNIQPGLGSGLGLQSTQGSSRGQWAQWSREPGPQFWVGERSSQSRLTWQTHPAVSAHAPHPEGASDDQGPTRSRVLVLGAG